MIGNRNIRRGLMAVLMAVAMVFPLAGCVNEADADDAENGSNCIDVRGDFTADECRIKLHDGRTVTCINFNTYKGGAVFPAIGTMLAARTWKRNNEKEQK